MNARTAEEVTATFETQPNGIRVAWLGEDGDSALVLGHGHDPAAITTALDLDGEHTYTERWMVGDEHSQGCEGLNEDVCKPCQQGEHEACDPPERHGCECADNDHDHELDVECGCEEYGWWVEFLTLDQALAYPAGHTLAVTYWQG